MLGRRPGPSTSRLMLAGLTASAPLIALASALTVTDQVYGATTAGSGAALTYILMVPAVLFGKALANGVWAVWRRAVLPFCLATAAVWVILGTTGHFSPLDGQFLITLFALGTWLFSLESKTARPAADPTLAAGLDNATPDKPERDSASPAPSATGTATPPDRSLMDTAALGRRDGPAVAQAATADVPVATSRMATILIGIAAAGLTFLAMPLLAAGQPHQAVYLIPVLGALTCAGPVLLAARGAIVQRSNWVAALGYAAMVAACLVPGLAGFLQPSLGAPPLYGPDGAFLALAAGLLPALGQDGLVTSRTTRRLLLATWGIWLTWILLSVLLARHPVAQPVPPDPSVWDLP